MILGQLVCSLGFILHLEWPFALVVYRRGCHMVHGGVPVAQLLLHLAAGTVEARARLLCGHWAAFQDLVGNEQLSLSTQCELDLFEELSRQFRSREERCSAKFAGLETGRLVDGLLQHQVLEGFRLQQ